MTTERSGAGLTQPEVVWWQGAKFRISARAETTAGALGLAEAVFWAGMGTPLHVHHREDEAFYILEGTIRFLRGDDEFVASEGDFAFFPREVSHCFKVLEGGARALVLMAPAGLEHMFLDGGIPVANTETAPPRDYDLEQVARLAGAYGLDIVGPPLD
jgi:mannose-6-phosphate isomerase-like protein (cupin superfamily)